MPAADRAAYCGSRASADEAATDRTLRGVIGVRATGQDQD
jgi:hypothetical protein